jgi:alginate O-acetyltransferase complex protein AlgI
MLFNSSAFVFIFMPVVFTGFFLLAKISQQGAIGWLAIASIFFYAYWSILALPILLISILTNYWFGILISRPDLKHRKSVLILAIAVNLAALGYYKYANFFIDNISELRILMDLDPWDSVSIILPIGISFFTFTQIAFLIDSFHGKVKEPDFIQYTLFVSFFPHLLAGPLLHHKQMMSQFSMTENFVMRHEKIIIGLSIFAIGLAKKILIADTLNGYVSGFYDDLALGAKPNFLASWLATIGYTFQLYFDFSGYSDMAVGAALLFGIWMPFNFNSPLRATSVIEFWQRWHITLTKYVGNYLYTPITLKFMRLSQKLPLIFETFCSMVVPTIIIFLILGFWHGANWTYLIFGGMHGIYIVVNHLWRKAFPLPGKKRKGSQRFKTIKMVAAWTLTFLAVNLAFVMFRSDNVHSAFVIYKGILGLNGYSLGHMPDIYTWVAGLKFTLMAIVSAFLIIFFMPNTIDIASLSKKSFLQKSVATYASILILIATIYALLQVNFYESPFLYFQF